jgi:hypothetical protein
MSAASALPWSRLNENQCVDFREGRFAKAFQKSAKQLLDAETYQRIMEAAEIRLAQGEGGVVANKPLATDPDDVSAEFQLLAIYFPSTFRCKPLKNRVAPRPRLHFSIDRGLSLGRPAELFHFPQIRHPILD